MDLELFDWPSYKIVICHSYVKLPEIKPGKVPYHSQLFLRCFEKPAALLVSHNLASWKRWKRQVRFAMRLWPLYRTVVLRVSHVRLSKDLIEWLINHDKSLFWRYPESWGQKSLYSPDREFTILFPALHQTCPAGSLWELCRTICFRPSRSSGRLTAQRFLGVRIG